LLKKVGNKVLAIIFAPMQDKTGNNLISLHISSKEICILESVHFNTAYSKIKKVREFLGRIKGRITWNEYADYFGYDLDKIQSLYLEKVNNIKSHKK
jgi:hypothetical protein